MSESSFNRFRQQCSKWYCEGFPGSSMIKNLPANAGDTRDVGSTPGSGRPPREGNGNPIQYSCLGNPVGSQRVGHDCIHTHTEMALLGLERRVSHSP